MGTHPLTASVFASSERRFRKAPEMSVDVDPNALRHAAEITADYAISYDDPEVAKLTLTILGALEVAGERQGAASLVRDDLFAVRDRER